MKMSKFEKKFGRYAIPNLTLYLIICYAAGYVIQLFFPGLTNWLTLDPYQILHGQIWRLFSWLLIPPSSLDFFTIIMLLFYYNIGTTLEKTWGTFRYNVFLFSGMILTVLAAFLCVGVYYLVPGMLPFIPGSAVIAQVSSVTALFFSTYYISISIFLGFAMTYPDTEVLLMFIFPIKVKWLGIFDLVILLVDFFRGNIPMRFAIGAALLNVLIFYLTTKSLMHLSPKQMKRRSDFRREVKKSAPVTKHKCAVCGRTDEDAPELQFRFCSKCNGNYEYCQYHLFTHEHVK